MSLGGNLASGNTSKINDAAIQQGIPKVLASIKPNKCCSSGPSIMQPVAVYPSMFLNKEMNVCPPVSPADAARYPKIAVQCSLRTQAMASSSAFVTPINRFSQYDRYKVPAPCPPVPPSMAGMSLPSSIPCIGNIYPNT